MTRIMPAAEFLRNQAPRPDGHWAMVNRRTADGLFVVVAYDRHRELVVLQSAGTYDAGELEPWTWDDFAERERGGR